MGVVEAMVETCVNVKQKFRKTRKKLTFTAQPPQPLTQNQVQDQKQHQN